MGYLNNNTITVEAILTKKGREILSRGGSLDITQFAVSDDEIDYSLWTTTHPLGSAYYGAVIENMPLTEAVPDETQVMKYKLVTLPRYSTTTIPIITLGGLESIVTTGGATSITITPGTSNVALNGPAFGFTAVLFDATAGFLTAVGDPVTLSGGTTPSFFGDLSTANAVVVRGRQFTFTPKDVPSRVTTKLTVIGNETGGSITIPVTVKKKPATS
jgi:hypothetical protein